jgi:hypothetical protein
MRGIDEQAGLSISARKRKSDEKGEKRKDKRPSLLMAFCLGI